MRKIKLDIGAGSAKRDDDYIAVDLVGGDVRANMWALPFKDNEVDSIWSAHALEHVPMVKVPATLREWCRVMRPGGRLIVQVPNFDYVAKYWLTGQDRAWAEAMIFGQQRTKGDFHQCAFTSQTLRGDLEGTGWEVKRVEMRWNHSQETLQAVAMKPRVTNG